MTKKDLISSVQGGQSDLTKKKVGEVVDALFTQISGALQHEGRYSHPGFGTFTVKTRAARTGRNPRTGEAIQIPESRIVNFKPAPDAKAAVN